MTKRLVLEWPDPRPFRARDGAPIKILAVSDDLESALTDKRNRAALQPIDLILGCGDLDYDDLAYVADAMNAPLVYVRGNHDFKESWEEKANTCPQPLGSSFLVKREGLAIGGLEWPGQHSRHAGRSDIGAWRQSISLAAHWLGHSAPLIVISHVPPAGVGDVPSDPYHRGFEGYAWAMRHLRPFLWLHGHTPLAATREWHLSHQGTEVVNATGAVLIELCAPGTTRAAETGDATSGSAGRSNGMAASIESAPHEPAPSEDQAASGDRAASDDERALTPKT